jgi:polyisoprenyl-teichoic acid--peptidoglycan teichoic acid transferase
LFPLDRGDVASATGGLYCTIFYHGEMEMKILKRVLALSAMFLLLLATLIITDNKSGLLFSESNDINGVAAQGELVLQDAPAKGVERETVSGIIGLNDSAPNDKDVTAGKSFNFNLVENGSINILIVGEDKLNFLYDTIGIASIDRNAGKVKFIMIPRDTYIEYNSRIIDALVESGKNNEPGIYKINYSHNIGNIIKYEGKFKSASISFLAEVIKEKFGVDADDYIKVDLDGFIGLIDLFDGIDIDVPYDMNYDDPVQNLSIHLTKGLQHLDGNQAEGFVRYRQGYREDGTFFEIGDVGRKRNQINLINALIKQKGTVANINKVPEILVLLGKNVQHSIGLGDLLQTYLGMAKDIVLKKYDIESQNLDGTLGRINGTSYIILDGG